MSDFRDGAFQWDEDKSADCYARRGFGFDFACKIFEGEHLNAYDREHSDEEDRYVSIGVVTGVFVTVVWTERGEERRIISAWRSAKWEIDEYAEAFRTDG